MLNFGGVTTPHKWQTKNMVVTFGLWGLWGSIFGLGDKWHPGDFFVWFICFGHINWVNVLRLQLVGGPPFIVWYLKLTASLGPENGWTCQMFVSSVSFDVCGKLSYLQDADTNQDTSNKTYYELDIGVSWAIRISVSFYLFQLKIHCNTRKLFDGSRDFFTWKSGNSSLKCFSFLHGENVNQGKRAAEESH